SEGQTVMAMPNTPKVHQTKGFIDGGGNVFLAETAASVGASRLIAEDEITFGMEINANHLRTVRNGLIYATATMRHKGKSTQVWEIDITDEDRSEENTSELQSRFELVCRLLLETTKI